MRSSALLRVALLAALVTNGCSDATTPESAAPQGADRALLGDLLQVLVLQRNTALPTSYTTSGVIGTGGGTLRIPEAGFTITFPAGAVKSPVTVRATAISGRNVAYQLEPHGLVFDAQPTITQDLSLTEVVRQLLLLGQLEGGYFPGTGPTSTGTVQVSETLPASTSLLPLRMSFRIRHFSGYAATRRPGGYISSSGTRIPGTDREP